MLLLSSICFLTSFVLLEVPVLRPHIIRSVDNSDDKQQLILMEPPYFALRAPESWSLFSRCKGCFLSLSLSLDLFYCSTATSWSWSPTRIPILSSPCVVFGAPFRLVDLCFFSSALIRETPSAWCFWQRTPPMACKAILAMPKFWLEVQFVRYPEYGVENSHTSIDMRSR